MDLDAAFINYSKNESARNIMSKCTNHHPFFSEGLAKAPYCVVVFEQHYAQWNPVNPVTNGPEKSGCINGENKNLTDLVFVQARLKWP